jgi:hypothetical protein
MPFSIPDSGRYLLKPKDVAFAVLVASLFAPFFLIPAAFAAYKSASLQLPMLTSFLKFAALATLGECLGLRIRTGRYSHPGFGILPRAVVWGFLGMAIRAAFTIFTAGTPRFLAELGAAMPPDILKQPLSGLKVLASFSASVAINLVFAPVLMILHQVTDEHIGRSGGTLRGLFTPIAFGDILAKLNWPVLWNFIFKITIPLFWIPAHTVTFLLPPEYQIVFAAALGIVLGVLLAVAARMKT